MLHGLGLAGCLFAGVPVLHPTLDRAQRSRTRGVRIRDSRTRTDRTRNNRTRYNPPQLPVFGPAPIIAGDRPPPAHPERLVPDQPWTEAEREIWNELRDVLVWPL